jgi:hypothetical protein
LEKVSINSERKDLAQKADVKSAPFFDENQQKGLKIVALLDLFGEAECRDKRGKRGQVEAARSIAEAVSWAVNRFENKTQNHTKIGKKIIFSNFRCCLVTYWITTNNR